MGGGADGDHAASAFLLLVILMVWVVSEPIMPPMPMPPGAPSIIRE